MGLVLGKGDAHSALSPMQCRCKTWTENAGQPEGDSGRGRLQEKEGGLQNSKHHRTRGSLEPGTGHADT